MSSEVLYYKSLVDRYLKETSGQLAGLSFSNIFVWQDFFEFQFEEMDGNLCIFASEQAGVFLYLPLLGKTMSAKAITQCFERMCRINKGSAVTRIENVSQEQLVHFPSQEYKIYKKSYEYLYYRKDLVGLKGDDYKPKRNAYNHFVKNFSATYCPYECAMAAQCLELYDSWEKAKRLSLQEEIDLALLEDNKSVHRRVLSSFDQLDLIGRVVQIQGKIIAYTFGYFVSAQTFCVLCEIADKEYQGLATYIFNQLCQDLALRDVKFINAMDDFALENVNRTKMFFRPVVLLPIYTVSPLG